jgi:hypothetical protein
MNEYSYGFAKNQAFAAADLGRASESQSEISQQ